MRRAPLFAALCAAPVIVGCAATGVKVSEQQVKSFKVGTSTYSDVVAALGAPTTTTVAPNGTQTASYNYSRIRSQLQTFFPYFGPIGARYDQQLNSVSFTFDQRGVLTGTASHNGYYVGLGEREVCLSESAACSPGTPSQDTPLEQ